MARKKKEQLYQVEKRTSNYPEADNWNRQIGRLTMEQAEQYIADRPTCPKEDIRISKDNG